MKLFALIFAALASPVMAESVQRSSGGYDVTEMARGLDQPWSIGFLPDGAVLITERDGALHILQNGRLREVSGVPRVWARGQGGLMDVLVPRDFSDTREILFSYSKRGRGEGTAIGRARLSENGQRLSGFRELFAMTGDADGGRHFGGRLVEAGDGTIFLTIGDRGEQPSAQDLATHQGTVIRIARDGSVPQDNPFVGRAGAQPEIWSYGHRNPQGAALDAEGQLWVHEHGARGGDEVNLVRKGANYGWPVIAYGVNYNGSPIGEGRAKAGMQQPELYWDPSIAPSGMAIYSGALWPQWQGDLLVGSLKFDYIARLDGSPLREVEQIRLPQTGRVRDVREAPDGSVWFLSVLDGAAYRITPGG